MAGLDQTARRTTAKGNCSAFRPTLAQRVGAYLDRYLGVIFLLPGVGITILIIAYPVVSNFFLSFTDKHLFYPGTSWVGLENYAFTFEDEDFYWSFLATLIWTVSSVAIQLILGLLAALLLNLPLRGIIFFRLMMIAPYAFPPITVALVWKWLLHSLFGVLNFLLVGVGVIAEPVSWFSAPTTSMVMAVLVNVWFGFPLFALAILAGLQSIPNEHYEVAKIEGATALQTFWYVILPAIIKIVGIVVVLRTIWIFNTFDLIFLLTGGGPGRATETLPLYAYRVGWGLGFIGQTSSIAVILFIVLAALIWVYFKIFRIEEEQ